MTNKRFMFRFEGLPKGHAGKTGIYTITVKADDKEHAAYKLTQRYKITRPIYNRQLKG